MAQVQIVLNQGGAPAGVAGRAREDLVTGSAVALSLTGGPYAQVLWTIRDKPVVTKSAPAQSSAFIVAPSSASTSINPDFAGTYNIGVAVDSGQGLGATVQDNATITFYAGPALAPSGFYLPRRRPAFLERTEHNVPDAIFGSGNPRGWAQELSRWFDVLEYVWDQSPIAWARVALTAGGASIVGTARNISGVARNAPGNVTATFTKNPANTNYLVIATARGSAGFCMVDTEMAATFNVTRYNGAGAATDADFALAVFADKV